MSVERKGEPNWRIHPGEILREEFLAPLGMSAHQLAMALRVPATRINDIVNEKRGRRRKDTFATAYKCNSPQRIAECAMSSGFEVEHIDLWEGRPEYLRFSALTYLGGFLYERTVNRFKTFSTFRSVIVFTLRKGKGGSGPCH